jgi:flagellar hook-associated protein 1 FlgK
MASNIFTAALTGMNAAQYGISTTEHNISNASTPGYSRQQVLLSPGIAQNYGSGFVGQGVDITGVKRVYDQFLNAQVLQGQTQASYLSSYNTAISQVDTLLSNSTAGVSVAMQDLFNGMNGVSNNPGNVPSRQAFLGNAQTVVNGFQSINQQLSTIANGLNGQISNSVTSINSYARQIAALNTSIKLASGTGTALAGQQPNDLLDQRDQLINQVNQIVQTSTVPQPDGSVSVFIGNGQALVMGSRAMTLQAVPSSNDPGKLDIAYQSNGQNITLQQSDLQGGSLGAYLNFRDQSLDPARNALGRIAIGLATSFNQQNQLGQDLNGALGGNLFNAALPQVTPNAKNTGTASVSGTITDVSGLTASDYQLKFDGTNYSMVRLSDKAVTNLGAGPLTPSTAVDGFTVNISSGSMAAGDSFLIRPTANGARDIALLTNDPARIAAGTPVIGSAALTNTGSGTIASGTVNPPPPATPNPAHPLTDLYLLQPVTVTFNNPPITYSLTSSNASIAADVPSATPLTVGPTSVVTVTSTNNMMVGAPVNGGGFPPGTTVGSITNGTTFVAQMPVGGATNPPAPVSGQTLQVGNYPYISGGVSLSNATVAGSAVTVASTANLVVGAPVSGAGFPAGTTITSITNGTTFVTSAPAVPAAATGQPIQVGNTFNGWVAQISGAPAAGDVFSVGQNSNAAGDNRNALLMAGLQTQNLMANGTANLGALYSQLVGDVGSKAQEMGATSQAQNNMVAQMVTSQQSVSGVNLDEEAANLMRYQNAYQASAKAMQIATTMFDTLLSLGK